MSTGAAPVKNGRLAIFYIVMAVIVTAVVVIVFTKGQDEKAQPPIAGGYDATTEVACLGAPPAPWPGAPLPATAPAQPVVIGPSFDVKQSGQFVNLSNTAGTLSGKLRLQKPTLPDGGHKLTGSVNCVGGGSKQFNGEAISGAKGAITGTLGGAPVAANFKRDPPDPGTPKPRAPGSLAADYKISPRSTCFGGAFTIDGSGSAYTIHAGGQNLGAVGYRDSTGAVGGDVKCLKGGTARLRGSAVDRNINSLTLIPLDTATPVPVPAGAPAGTKPTMTTPSGLSPAGEKVTATENRTDFGDTVAAFFIAAAIVMLIARLFGILAVKIGQPRVMGEVVAGICLGPSVLGAISPDAQAAIFPTDILPAFGIAANLGLIFYMFLVGLELDRKQLKGRGVQAAAISNASVALPMMLGIAAALPLYKLLGPDKKFVAFAIFMGVSMSITAFPVLARILVERRMLKKPVGALSLACAAIDDVTAWFLIALATAVATQGTFGEVAKTVALAVAFTVAMFLLVRPVLGRLSKSFDQVGRIPPGWVAAIFAGVLLSAVVTQEIGIAVIFGGFIMGTVMPRNARLTEDVTRRTEDFVIVLLLPMFFAYTGLRTNIGLLNSGELWLITLALIAIAIVGKLFGAMIAARISGFDTRASAAIGTLMNTRGLTELIVLNLALSAGVISDALFAALVIMALVTTFMAGPLLNLLDPKNEYGSSADEELEEARRESAEELAGITVPDRAILVAPQTDAALPQLLSLAEPLARSEPPRELILARLVLPPRAAGIRGALQTENELLRRANRELDDARKELIDDGVAVRTVAFSSKKPGDDLNRLAETQNVDLVLVEGSRPLLGEAIPLGEVKQVLESAPSDVAVLMAREGDPIRIGPDSPVLIPFGGAEHDWSALELGAWLAARADAPLKLLGAAGQTDEGKSVSRLLGDAGLLVQQFAGIPAEPVVSEGGREGVLAAARGAGLLVIGLSDRWKQEGLGQTRSDIAKQSDAPVIFVRRGTRPGALAPRDNVTRFTWSSANMGIAGRRDSRLTPSSTPEEPTPKA